MKKLAVLFIACWLTLHTLAQTDPRISITTITPSENTGQNYTPWLNDNLNSLVANVGGINAKYIDVTVKLADRSLVSKLSFYDDAGVFTTNPAYIYALNGTEKIYLGKFEGLTYKTFVNLIPSFPVLADAIIIHKYCNNIPQKIQVFGQPYIAGTSSEPQEALTFTSAIPSENTGQDYSLWLDNNIDNSIPWGNANSFKYIDVTLKLQQRSKIKKFSFWDTEGEFSSNPCYFYAIKDTQKIFLGTFTGPTYNTWIDLILPEAVTADSILVHKYSRYIPQKIKAFGQPLLKDPIDTFVKPEGRIKITDVLPSQNTGQNYSSWLTDNLDSLVPGVYTAANLKYTEITLPLESKSKVGRLSFYDYEGVFTTNPAYIYAKNDTVKTLLGLFTGPTYKTFVDLLVPDSAIADAIVIRKYGNNIPQKIKVYGAPYTPPPVIDLTPIVKIPIDPKRWYQLNNSTDGIDKMFDGITSTPVYAGYGKIITNYDAYYALRKDEQVDISGIKFYDGEGALGDYPITLSVIDDQGKKTAVASFNGNRYNQWVGPYPNRENNADNNHFNLDSMMKNVRYLVLNCWYMYPTEIELYGHYQSSAIDSSSPLAKSVRFKDAVGINAFEWDFESPYNPYHIDSASYKGIKNFSGVRHYMDWEKLESNEGSYTYSPVHSGGWNYDAIYEQCKADGIEVLACLKTIPGWMQDTYPASERDAENVPVPYGSDFTSPLSYIKQAKMGFQYIARYGSNTAVNPALLSVNGQPRWTNDEVNTVKIGLGVIKYIECDNERDKWWKGRKAYQTSYEYAANLSAFYDGHKNTMGPGVGVKNADPTVKVVMGGIAQPDPSYVRGMIEWCRINRGYKADGSVNLCWDIINYHLYSNDAKSSQNGNSTRGTAPEKSEASDVAKAFRKLAHEEAKDMPVWITELGYDENQGSPLKAIPIGDKTVLQTQADWNLRSALLYAREGVERTFFYQLYDDNAQNPTQFGSMGFLNQDRSRKPAADFLMQTNKLIGNYVYKQTLNSDPLVDKYELDGSPAYALMIPDEVGRTATYNLDLADFDSATICTPLAGSDTMKVQRVKVLNGKVSVVVTETPVFVLPIVSSLQMLTMAPAPPIAELAIEKLAGNLKVYPNPSSDMITITTAGDKNFATEINIIAAATGKNHVTVKAAKGNGQIVKTINLTNLPTGLYKLQITQGKHIEYKSILKIKN